MNASTTIQTTKISFHQLYSEWTGDQALQTSCTSVNKCPQCTCQDIRAPKWGLHAQEAQY